MIKKTFVSSFIIVLLASCAPTYFVQTSEVNWSTIPIRDDLTYDLAFDEVIDVIAKQFEMEMISKEAGYARTGWIYTWNTSGKYEKNYRNKVIIKFSVNKKTVEIKTEAQYGKRGGWKSGFDSKLLQTVKQDIMGVVGRTTR